MDQGTHKSIFNDWIYQYKALLFKVVRSYAYNALDQDDLFQEISIQVWKSIPKFRKESAVSTWLYRVSLNTAMSWKRKEKKHIEGRKDIQHITHLIHENTEAVDERLAWLYEEISRLPTLDKSLTLLLLDGFSYKEMSNILGISESNVGVKINRIKKYLTSKTQKSSNHGTR